MEILSPRNNNTYEKNGDSDHIAKTSPVLPTVRRVGAGHKTKTNQWQDFIDREQTSVDYLIRNSFATLRKGILNIALPIFFLSIISLVPMFLN